MALDLADKTGNSNTLTNVGADEITSSLPHAAITEAAQIVRANSDYLWAADSPSLSITGSMTIELWIKLESLPGTDELYRFVSKYDDTTGQRSYMFWLQNTGGTYYLIWINTSTGSWQGNRVQAWTPSTGVWYHVAVVFDASGNTLRFYVDGVQQGADQAPVATSIYDSTCSVTIGAQGKDSTPANFLNGIIADVRIWNVARTAAQILENKNQLLNGTDTGLVAYWPFQANLRAISTQYLKERYHNREDMGGYSLG